MKIFNRCLLMLAFIFATCVIHVSAAKIDHYSMNIEGQYVDVSGYLDYEGDASILIQYKNSEMTGYAVDSVYQKATEANKHFSYRFHILNKRCSHQAQYFRKQ